MYMGGGGANAHFTPDVFDVATSLFSKFCFRRLPICHGYFSERLLAVWSQLSEQSTILNLSCKVQIHDT